MNCCNQGAEGIGNLRKLAAGLPKQTAPEEATPDVVEKNEDDGVPGMYMFSCNILSWQYNCL